MEVPEIILYSYYTMIEFESMTKLRQLGNKEKFNFNTVIFL